MTLISPIREVNSEWKILVCNWIGCCEQLFDDPSGESFTVETGVVSFLQGILFFSN